MRAKSQFAHDAGLFGGVLLPGVPPNHEIPPLWSDVYEPLWALCEELDVVVNHHSGGGLPAFDVADPAARAVMLVEIPIYAHRALWALIFAGVFERHPNLKFVLTEQGTSWVPGTLANLDWFAKRMRITTAAEYHFGGAAVEQAVAHAERVLPAQLLDRRELPAPDRVRAAARRRRRPHHVGQRLPALRRLVPVQPRGAARRVRRRAGVRGPPDARATPRPTSTASTSTRSTRSRARVGPTVAEIAEPLVEFPADSTCNAFDPDAIVRTW